MSGMPPRRARAGAGRASRKLSVRALVLAWCIGIALTASISLALFYAARRTVEHEAEMNFQHLSLNTRNAITGRVASLNGLIHSVVALFQTSDNLTRAQFHQFALGLDLPHNFPAIKTLTYTQYIAHKDKARFEQKVRQDRSLQMQGFPGFSLHADTPREYYYVQTYMEPADYAAPGFGADIGVGPAMAESLDLTRDTGLLTGPGQPVLVDGAQPYVGLTMRHAVYRSNTPPMTQAERRAAYIGTVGISFQVTRLIEGAIDEMAVRNVHVMLFDGGNFTGEGAPAISQQDVLLYDSAGATVKTPALMRQALGADASRFSTTLPINFNGRLWKAHFSVPKEALFSSYDFYSPWIAFVASMIGTLLIYTLFFTLSSSRRRAMALARTMTAELRASQVQLQESHSKLRQLAAHADQIREDERKRIAREIHDDLGQNLLVLRIDVVMLATRTVENHPKLHLKVRETLNQIDNTIKSVRQIINDLRPNVLDLGLNAAVEWQVAQFEQRTGIRCQLVENQTDIALDDKNATALFRILQESLSNISRHAKASQVRVELHRSEATLAMVVSDNGIGMQRDSRHKPGSFGLIGIEERISQLGGTLAIQSEPGAGVTLSVTVPLPDRRRTG